ncbi:MAG: YccF domain-containing protein [Bacteroidales bacterium]|nr:YccF domain-containing protein [Bacteroidales bacterium]
MNLLGNILWLIFGGLVSAIGYFVSSLALALTIVGIPFAVQTFKIGLFTLSPFGNDVIPEKTANQSLATIMNIVWILIGGLWLAIVHVVFGLLLSISIIGIPFGVQHFKLAQISLVPFGKRIIKK